VETKNVLMIDDDEDDFLLLQSAFHRQAPWVNLIWFDSPDTFLASRIWEQQSIHLLVFDMMVGKSEPHWQINLRRQIGRASIPMVIHSGSVSPLDHRSILDDGAVDFLEKGASTGEMAQVVSRMLTYLT
jgi:DNA-binding NtrC family response regulator